MKLNFLNFKKILNNNFLFEARPIIVVGVSGGPDSIALAFLLNEWIKNKKGKLLALIIDHNIRKESYLESIKVKKILNSLNVKNRILRVKKQKVSKLSMQVARENRLNKIIEYCIRKKIFHIFLGHHYDDNIETYILRKIAGSNLEGLNSMNLISIYNKVQILRPLLFFKKKDILKFNKMNKLQYIIDPTNNNLKYT